MNWIGFYFFLENQNFSVQPVDSQITDSLILIIESNHIQCEQRGLTDSQIVDSVLF